MTRTGTLLMLAAMLTLGAAAPLHAQEITSARIKELIREAALQAAQPPATPGASAAAPASRVKVPLTLDDTVKLALDRNLDIAVQRLNPEIQDISVASIAATYHPAVTSTLSAASQSTPANSSLAGGQTAGAPVDITADNYNGGIAQNVPWGGGSFTAALNNSRNTTTSLNTLYNPAYNTLWTGTYTQPLMRNFAIDTTRRSLQVTKLNRDVSDIQLRATITNIVSNVRAAYWNYVYSGQAVGVAQQSVDLADQLVKDNQTRVEVGTMAPIDVVTAKSQAAAARQNLVVAQVTRATNEIALKRLIVNGTEDPNWNAELDAIDQPEFAPQPVDLEAAVRRALSERTDLQIVKKDLQMNDVTLNYLRDQLKPQADLLATYGVTGLGGTQLVKAPNTGVNSQPIGFLPGNYLDALSPLFRNQFPRWTAQINFSYPLFMSSQKASVARARVQMNQVQAQVKQIELQIATDVTNAAVTLTSNAERVQAAQAARELADETMKAEQSKFEVGMSTNYNVILTQRDLATAQINELQAILNYRIALVELERLQQTTLQSQSITILSPTAAGVITVAAQ